MASGPLSATPGPANPSAQSPQPSWEGDKMFNIYIYDYCNKRGFRETAQKLMVEAEIAPDSAPPINAKQGLLFEWWSVFWVLFTAKSSGVGTEDAMLYIQQQQRQAAARMQPQQPMGRFLNGVPRQPGAMPPNGPMPNGVGASLQAAQGPMPNGMPGSMPFPVPASGPQQNGIPGTVNGPPAAGSQQPPNFTMLAGHRPGGPQQRGPTNGPQFQSPTMAHSPQNSAAVPGQQQIPMSQLGPSPHMGHMQRGGNMLPPNGAQGPQQAPNPPYPQQQQQQRPPSRTASPSNMTQPSPSMAARQPPGNMPISAQEAFMNEFSKIPPPLLNTLKQEFGFDKDVQALSMEERQRILTAARQRSKPGAPGANNAVAGPSVQLSNQRNQQRQGVPQQQQQQQQQQPRGSKRNSTSPAEEPETLPRTEASPPDRKRPRRSPLSAEQAPPMNYSQPSQRAPGGVQQMPNGTMRPIAAPVMNGFSQGGMQNMNNNPGMSIPMGQGIGGPPMGNPMSPQGNLSQQQHQIAQQYQQQQYRQSMQALHKNNIPPGGLNSVISGNAGSPTSGDATFNGNGSQGRGPQFAGNGAQDHRMNQNKPIGMMPPPSPAIGTAKDQSGQNKDKAGPSTSSNRPEGSPRNQNPNPGPSHVGNTGQGGTAPPTPNNAMTAPSPSAILVNTPTSMNPPSQSMAPPSDPMAAIFGNAADFMTLPLDFDDSSLSKTDFGVDFERDFGQWFNPGSDGAGLDQK